MRREAENNEQATCADAMTEIERILASRTFHGRETMQRLLSYLAERTMEGSAESLKEYTIGMEVFGKPADYDPQEDASVRVQVGRLRQKLEEYSRAEGVNDPILIELPKRQYALLAHRQSRSQLFASGAEKNSEEVDSPSAPVPVPAMRSLPMPSWPSFLLGALIATIVWAGWSFRRMETKTEFRASPELDEFWRPFLSGERPVTMAMTMRPFLCYDHGVVWEWGLAAQYKTDSQYARELLSKLKGRGGSIPRHYQVVVHARFQSLVPVEIKYITHRELY